LDVGEGEDIRGMLCRPWGGGSPQPHFNSDVKIGRKISWEKRNSTVDAGIDTLGV
jgi:hypothetical protein